MHLPDGFLSPPVWISGAAVSSVGLAVCTRVASRSLKEREIPLMGVLGAFVFAAQMINVPVAAGTSGHMVGATLLAVLLRPAAAAVVMACVLAVQCLLFQDGGLTTLGANFLDMGLIPILVGYAAFRVGARLRRRSTWPAWAGVFVGAWAGTVIGSGLAALQLGLSGAVPLVPGTVAMVSVHTVIGLVEGTLTLGVLRSLRALRPDLVPELGSARTEPPPADCSSAVDP